MSNKSISHSTVYNLAGSIVPVIVMIVTVPVYIRLVGVGRFGILSLIWLLFGYLGLFDFGLSRATSHRLAKLRNSSSAERSAVFYSALLVNGAIGLVIAAVFYFAAGPIFHYLAAKSPELAEEIPATFPWIATLFPLALVGGVFLGSLEAEERFFEINVQQSVGAVLLQGLPLVAVLLFGPRLEVSVIAAAAARVVSLVWNGVLSVHAIPPNGRSDFRPDIVRSLLKYGGWIALSNSIVPFLVSAHQFVIATQLGAGAVTYYAIPNNVAIRLHMLPSAVSRSLFPRLSGLLRADAYSLAFKSSAFIAAALAVLCIPAIVLADFGLTLWLGADFAAHSAPLARLILVGIWINGIAFVPFVLLQSQGRPDVAALFHALEIVPFLVALWFLIGHFGLMGAAIAFVLRVSLDSCLLYTAIGDVRRHLRVLLPWAGAVVTAWLFAEYVSPGWPIALLVGTASFAAGVLAILYFDATVRERAGKLVARIRKGRA